MMKKMRLFLIYATGVLVLVWGIGFCGFCFYAITLKYSADTPVEAVVALTGGADRIQTAALKAQEKAVPHLLISGIHQSVSKDEMLARLNMPPSYVPTLGYRATNTAENAVEVAEWVDERQLKSILLVTSFYHMPRAMFEILKQAPDLVIVPYPVFPKSFNNSVEWVRTKYAWFLFLEYNKFITVHILSVLRSWI